jgi:hypothetical protein
MIHRLLAVIFGIAVTGGAPPADYSLMGSDESPKRTFRIEKYLSEEDALVWLRDSNGHAAQLWMHKGNPIDPYVYISPDEHWIVCVAKLYAGVSAAWLYKRTGHLQYTEVTPSPFSDRAWTFFRTETHRSFEQNDRYQISTGTWFPKAHSLLVELFGDDGKTFIVGWYCYYDLEKDDFYLDSTLKKKNINAVSDVVPKT